MVPVGSIRPDAGGAAPVEPGPEPPNGLRWSLGISKKATVAMLVTSATLPPTVAAAGAA